MDDAAPPAAPSAPLPTSNVTHANITGKVVRVQVRPRRSGKGRRVKLSSDQRSHVKTLAKQGRISSRAATSHGLQGKK